jgi:hypothetical protein
MKLWKAIGLRKEAVLLDSWLYIAKSMLAIAAGFLIGKAVPIAKLDMITALVGVMYTLEPVNLHGIKGGLSQLLTSALGAAATAAVVQAFGLNAFTVAISMGLVLYVSIKINWRMVSPTAIFTSIYMTQNIRIGPQGTPSMLYTFLIRITALGLGVLVAIIFNWLFSALYYKRLPEKRLELVKMNTIEGFEHTREILSGEKTFSREAFTRLLTGIFSNIEMVSENMAAMLGEGKRSDEIRHYMEILWRLKEVNHLTYDTGYAVAGGQEVPPELKDKALKVLAEAEHLLSMIDYSRNKAAINTKDFEALSRYASDFSGSTSGRIEDNIRRIAKNLLEVIEMTNI